MGIFSKSVTKVGTAAVRVVEDKDVPNAVKNGFMKAIMEGDNQLMEYAMEEMANGMGLRAARMYSYGKEHFLHGLPESYIVSTQTAEPQVQAVLNDLHGSPVAIQYHRFGAYNYLHHGWSVLVNSFHYNDQTNEIVDYPGKPEPNAKMYLEDMIVMVPQVFLDSQLVGAFDQWGTPANAGSLPTVVQDDTQGSAAAAQIREDRIRLDLAKVRTATPFHITTSGTVPSLLVKVVYIHKDGNIKTLQRTEFSIPLSGLDVSGDWHMVNYKVAGEVNSRYWTYRSGTGTYDDIDVVYSRSGTEAGSFFPWTYFRHGKAAIPKSTPDYESNKLLLNKLRMDYDTVVEAINGNEDVDDVESAMMMMAVPADSKNEHELRYLFDFFNRLAIADPYSREVSSPFKDVKALLDPRVVSAQSRSESAILIQDKRFKMSLSYGYISKRTIKGDATKKGTYHGTFAKDTKAQNAIDAGTGAQISWLKDVPRYTYYHYFSDTQCEEIVVYNLKMSYYVYGDYTAVSDEENDILLVPLDYSLTDNYQLLDREQLYARSLHFIFNSRIVQKLKWYQTSLFRAIVIIIMIIITIITVGATWQGLVTAFGIGGVTAAAVYLLVLVLKIVIIKALVRKFVKAVGQKYALLTAVLLAVRAYVTGDFSSVGAGMQGTPWALELLSVSGALIEGVQQDIAQDLANLFKEYEAFDLMKDTKNKEIEEAQNLLNGTTGKIPMIIFGETPDEYYQRTVHSGNIGVLSLDAIESYVDVALSLPKITETIDY